MFNLVGEGGIPRASQDMYKTVITWTVLRQVQTDAILAVQEFDERYKQIKETQSNSYFHTLWTNYPLAIPKVMYPL